MTVKSILTWPSPMACHERLWTVKNSTALVGSQKLAWEKVLRRHMANSLVVWSNFLILAMALTLIRSCRVISALFHKFWVDLGQKFFGSPYTIEASWLSGCSRHPSCLRARVRMLAVQYVALNVWMRAGDIGRMPCRELLPLACSKCFRLHRNERAELHLGQQLSEKLKVMR